MASGDMTAVYRAMEGTLRARLVQPAVLAAKNRRSVVLPKQEIQMLCGCGQAISNPDIPVLQAMAGIYFRAALEIVAGLESEVDVTELVTGTSEIVEAMKKEGVDQGDASGVLQPQLARLDAEIRMIGDQMRALDQGLTLSLAGLKIDPETLRVRKAELIQAKRAALYRIGSKWIGVE